MSLSKVEPVEDSERAAWLAERRGGIGGSDIAALVGVTSWRKPFNVYWEKVGERADAPPSEAALWGQLLEAPIAQEWARRFGRVILPGHFARHPEHDWWVGTPDYIVVSEDGFSHELLEVKKVGLWQWRTAWDEGAAVPLAEECQVQWYLGLLGLSVAHVAVLVGGSELRTFRIEAQASVIDRLREAAESFWLGNVAPAVPPLPDGSERTRRVLEDMYPPLADAPVRALVESDVALPLVDDYRHNAEMAREYGMRRDESGNALRVLLGEAGADEAYLPGSDQPLFTWRRIRRVDVGALSASVDAETLASCMRVEVDMAKLRATLGRRAVEAFMVPSEQRVLRVANSSSE